MGAQGGTRGLAPEVGTQKGAQGEASWWAHKDGCTGPEPEVTEPVGGQGSRAVGAQGAPQRAHKVRTALGAQAAHKVGHGPLKAPTLPGLLANSHMAAPHAWAYAAKAACAHTYTCTHTHTQTRVKWREARAGMRRYVQHSISRAQAFMHTHMHMHAHAGAQAGLHVCACTCAVTPICMRPT